jgi:hypothetical protein
MFWKDKNRDKGKKRRMRSNKIGVLACVTVLELDDQLDMEEE